MILARSTNRYGAVRERTKVWSTRCSSAVSSRNCSGCLISASFLLLCLFAPFYFTMDLVIAPLSGASGKFKPLLEAVQCQAFCEADGVGGVPIHTDAYVHS